MTNSTQVDYNPGDLVRVCVPARDYGEWPHERVSYLAFVDVYVDDDLYRTVGVRPVYKPGLTFWVRPEQMELVQRGEQ